MSEKIDKKPVYTEKTYASNLHCENITLVIHAVRGMAMKTKRYLVRVRVKMPTGAERGLLWLG